MMVLQKKTEEWAFFFLLACACLLALQNSPAFAISLFASALLALFFGYKGVLLAPLAFGAKLFYDAYSLWMLFWSLSSIFSLFFFSYMLYEKKKEENPLREACAKLEKEIASCKKDNERLRRFGLATSKDAEGAFAAWEKLQKDVAEKQEEIIELKRALEKMEREKKDPKDLEILNQLNHFRCAYFQLQLMQKQQSVSRPVEMLKELESHSLTL